MRDKQHFKSVRLIGERAEIDGIDGLPELDIRCVVRRREFLFRQEARAVKTDSASRKPYLQTIRGRKNETSRCLAAASGPV